MNTALSVQDLWFRYGRSEAVHGVSLELRPGDCYGFLGHNGAGKTTVMRLCLGLLRPQRGSVHLLGIDARRSPRLARAQVGALVERAGFHLQATARQNLDWLARLQGLSRRMAAVESSRALDRVGLEASADRRVGAFSLGMRQRLGIAQALLGSPRLLLLDEPTNGLDPDGIAELRTLLRQLSRDEGVAVFLSSHQLQELEGLCNRIGVLREGRMVLEGDVDDLRRDIRAQHVVIGTPQDAMASRLRALGLAPVADGDRLVVDLGGKAPGAVARELTAIGELDSFSPERITLETIYLRATHAAGSGPLPATPVAASSPTAVPSPTVDPDLTPDAEAAAWPLWRAFGHERRTLLSRPLARILLLSPALAAGASVRLYQHRVEQGLARLRAGELFSADAGSGHLAIAQALQVAAPVLALCLLWLASQAVAADLSRDTLRNTLVRSVGRTDVLLGKFGALVVAALGGWLVAIAAAITTAAARFGLGDLEEVSRHGDRQVLAAIGDVAPVFAQALGHCLLPLLAVAAVGLVVSTFARRPALALALALLAVFGPELLRSRLGEHQGWLLTSHLPTGLRDDSVLGYFAAIARGAADASWPWQAQAVLAPLLWLAASLAIALLVLRRLRVA